jgi:hypothetical protein
MKMGENMDVIFHPIYTIQMAIVVIQYSPNIFEQKISLIFFQAGNSIFGAKDNVIVDLKVGAHDRKGFTPHQIASLTDELAAGSFDVLFV